MSFVYTPFKQRMADPGTDLSEGSIDVRVLLVMTNSTADTDQDAQFIANIGTLDEMDGANYARVNVANQTVTQDDANNRSEFSFDAFTWTALGAGTRNVLGAVIFGFVTNDADSFLIAYIDSGGFPFAANGGDVTYTPDAQGVLQVT